MASIDYPLPHPKNDAAREANRRAGDYDQRLEEEAADLLGWERECWKPKSS